MTKCAPPEICSLFVQYMEIPVTFNIEIKQFAIAHAAANANAGDSAIALPVQTKLQQTTFQFFNFYLSKKIKLDV